MRSRRAVTALGVTGMASVFLIVSPTPSSASGGHSVRIFDDCEAQSFNGPGGPGPGTCVGDGETTFPEFIAELRATKQAEEWRFKPENLKVEGGRPVIVENRGGELHTFTMVDKFGGGFVPPLNALSGNTTVAPECVAPPKVGVINLFVTAGSEAAFQTAGLRPGTYQFQCCVHPWMRIILTVE